MTDTYRKLIDELAAATCPRAPSLNPEPAQPRRSDFDLIRDALSALRVLRDPSFRDWPAYLTAQTETKLARAEVNAASLNVELRLLRERSGPSFVLNKQRNCTLPPLRTGTSPAWSNCRLC